MSIIVQVGALRSCPGGSTDRPLSVHPTSDEIEMSSEPVGEIYKRPVHTFPGCFGLPYQDHNYGAPPPITPPPSPPPPPPAIAAQVKINGHIDILENVSKPSLIAKEEIVDDSITRCICEFQHDDGYMICCDHCSVWQHIDCMGIDRTNIPDSYYCERCQLRPVDVERAKAIQTRKKEELANLDTSATDTDPEELANRLAALEKKSPNKKVTKQRRNSKVKDKIGSKSKSAKEKKGLKKEKENLKVGSLKVKFKPSKDATQRTVKAKNRRNSQTVVKINENWSYEGFDRFEDAKENQYSKDIQELFSQYNVNGINSDDLHCDSERLLDQLWCLGQTIKKQVIIEAKETILPGLAVFEYKGIVLLRQHYVDTNLFFKIAHPHVLFYSKFEDIDLCIDSSSYGNKARYIRRSCSPNAEVRHLVEHGRIHFVIFSSKEIEKGEEITIPFDYNYQECMYCVECACLRNNCTVSKFWKKLSKNTQNNRVVKKPRMKSAIENITIKTELSPLKSEILKIKESIPLSPVKPVKKSVSVPVSPQIKEEPLPVVSPEKIVVPPPPPPAAVPVKSSPPKAAPKPVQKPTPKVIPKPAQPARVRHASCSVAQPVRVKHASGSVAQPVRVKHASGSDIKPITVTSVTSVSPTTSTPEKTEQEDLDHKMTREERKMNAIMKAFEKLAKREERRKEALARIDGHRKSQEEPKKVNSDQRLSSEEDSSKTTSEETSDAVDETYKPETPQKNLRKGRKRPLRRRSRVNSTSAAEVYQPPTDMPMPVSVSYSTPNTPLPASADVASANHSGFKFLKTKKHLFNEWLTEKGNDGKTLAPPPSPLEINVDETIFVPCLPSPRNTMEHLQRRNSQSAGSRLGAESSCGSAKKRWLRKAMHEVPDGCESGSVSPGCTSPNPGMCSPTPGGGTSSVIGSPTHGVSPNSSPPVDFVTPLKKRRLARESLSQDVSSTPSTPCTVDVQANQEEKCSDNSKDESLDLERSKVKSPSHQDLSIEENKSKNDSVDMESENEICVDKVESNLKDVNKQGDSSENSAISENDMEHSNSALDNTSDSGIVTDSIGQTQTKTEVEGQDKITADCDKTDNVSDFNDQSDLKIQNNDKVKTDEETDDTSDQVKEKARSDTQQKVENDHADNSVEQVDQCVDNTINTKVNSDNIVECAKDLIPVNLSSSELSGDDSTCTKTASSANLNVSPKDSLQENNNKSENIDFTTDNEASDIIKENGFICESLSKKLKKHESTGFIPSSSEDSIFSCQNSNLRTKDDENYSAKDLVLSSLSRTSDTLVSSSSASSSSDCQQVVLPICNQTLSDTVENNETVNSPGELAQDSTALPQHPNTASVSPPISDRSQPCKKKVSLLEYRNRLKSKSKGSSVNPPASSISKSLSSVPARVCTSLPNIHKPTLPSLPLFVDKSKQKKKVKEKKSWHDLSLTERLRQEFGVEASEEGANSDDSREGSMTPPPPPPPPPVQKSPSPRLIKYKDGDENMISGVPPPPPHPAQGTSTPPPPPPPPKSVVSSRIPSLMSLPFNNRAIIPVGLQTTPVVPVLPLQSPSLVTAQPTNLVNYQAHNGNAINNICPSTSPQQAPYLHQQQQQQILQTSSFPVSQTTSPAYSSTNTAPSRFNNNKRFRHNSSPSTHQSKGREAPYSHSYNHTSDSVPRSDWSNGRRNGFSNKY